MTILLANGCSWTWGHGGDTEEERAVTTWPYYLGLKLNSTKTVNLSYGNASNSRIFRTTLNWLSTQTREDLDNTVAVIQFSEPSRNEFYQPRDENNVEENFDDQWVRYKPGLMVGGPNAGHLMASPYYHASQQEYLLWTPQLRNSRLIASLFSMIGLFNTYGIKNYWFWIHPGDEIKSEHLRNILKKTPWIHDKYVDPFQYEHRFQDPKWNTPTDLHPSPVGHNQIAEQIYNFIKDKLIL